MSELASEEFEGQLITDSPKLVHLTAQRPKVKGRRLPKRQGSLKSSPDDQSEEGLTLVTDSPKLTHLTAERPRVRGRRPPKRYASPQPVENEGHDEPQSLEDQLTEYENTIKLIAMDTTVTDKLLTLRSSIKTSVFSSITRITNKTHIGGSSFDYDSFVQEANELEKYLAVLEEMMERERSGVEGQGDSEREEALRRDLEEVRTQKRDLGELCAVQKMLHQPNSSNTERDTENENQLVNVSDETDPLLSTSDQTEPLPSTSDQSPPDVPVEIKKSPKRGERENKERDEDPRKSTEVVDVNLDTDRVEFGRHGNQEGGEDDNEKTPLLGGSNKPPPSATGSRLCDCCILL